MGILVTLQRQISFCVKLWSKADKHDWVKIEAHMGCVCMCVWDVTWIGYLGYQLVPTKHTVHDLVLIMQVFCRIRPDSMKWSLLYALLSVICNRFFFNVCFVGIVLDNHQILILSTDHITDANMTFDKVGE